MSEEALSDLLEKTANKTPVGAAPIDLMLERNGPSKRRRTWGVALASAAAVVAVGIVGQQLASDEAPKGPPATFGERVDLEGTWTVTALVDKKGQSLVPATHEGRAVLQFRSDGTVSGSSGCHSFGGDYHQNNAELRFGDIIQPGVAIPCKTADVPLAARLDDVRHVSGSGDVLHLEDADGTVIIELTFLDVLPPEQSTYKDVKPVLDGTWVLTALTRPSGQSALPQGYANEARMSFDEGTLGGTTGCNDIFGTYIQEGPRGQDLHLPQSDLGSTLVGCSEPPLVQRLTDVRHVSMYVTEAGNQFLQLHQDNWMIVAVLRPVGEVTEPPETSPTGPQPLEGAITASTSSDINGVWRVTSMARFEVPVDPDDPAAAFTGEWFTPMPLSLTFTDDKWRLEAGRCMFGQGGYNFSSHEFRHVDPVEGSGSRCPPENYGDIVNAENLILRTSSIVTANDELRLVGKNGEDMLVAVR